MLYNFEGLLINVLILIIFLLFVPLFLNRTLKPYSRKRRIAILTTSASIGIIACITFPIYLYDGYIFDLRYVASLIAGLYCGIPASIALWFVTVSYRFLFGGIGIYSTFLLATLVLIITVTFSKKFKKLSRIKKIIFGTSLSTSIVLFGILLSKTVYRASFNLPVNLTYALFQIFSTIILIYFLEVIRESAYLNKRLMTVEKTEIVSQLASSISHEVRNPLAVVRGFLQLMLQTDLPKEKRDEYLKISISEIDRANKIIRNYLSFAKPSTKNYVRLNIYDELNHAISIITPLANMNSIEIRTNIQPYFINGDKQLFQQCLLNITKNSIEAMKDGGILTIWTEKADKYVRIEIKDTGIGMTTEELTRLGEPYFSTKGDSGTGLGMMVAFHIIDQFNGKYRVQSKVNEGTCFSLLFPIVETEETNETIGT